MDVDVSHYNFLPIVETIEHVNKRVNLIGVAVDFTIPKPTKGTDCICSVRIIDESPGDGIEVRFFLKSMEKLPGIERVGDIVVVYNVLIDPMVSRIYALFNKKRSTFAIFEGRASRINKFLPYQVSARYRGRAQEKESIIRLRECFLDDRIEALLESVSLSEIEEGGDLTLLCKILHITKIKDEWMLFVWDGTDTPSISLEAKLEDQRDHPLPLAVEPFQLSRDILCTFPKVGTVLRLMVDHGRKRLAINTLKARWVKLLHVRCKAHFGLWRAELTPKTKLCYLPEDHNIVLQRQRSYSERISTKWGRMPSTSLPWPSHITETDHPSEPFATLMDVLTYSEVTCIFKCVVRVVALLPSKAEEFRSPQGMYRMRLVLEDPTARIHAFLFAEDGVKFFGDRDSIDELTKKANALLGVDNIARNPPWMQVCLKSYYINKNNVWGSRTYGIFDTTFVD